MQASACLSSPGPSSAFGESDVPDTAAELHGSYYEITPSRVLAWVDYPADVTRFEFTEAPTA